MEHTYSAIYDNVRIRPLEKADIENLRNWRNNEEKKTFDTKKSLIYVSL